MYFYAVLVCFWSWVQTFNLLYKRSIGYSDANTIRTQFGYQWSSEQKVHGTNILGAMLYGTDGPGHEQSGLRLVYIDYE